MRFRHRFLVNRKQSDVFAFHRDPAALVGITPPPLILRLDGAAAPLGEGDRIRFTTWIGFVPVRWHARIEQVDTSGFTDRQLSGPFRAWVHRHDFIPISEDQTEVRDEIEFSIRTHIYWGMVGLMMACGLPMLFAYRAWKTRRLLENR
jgi:ligand-binding SRPBCC domain-containing protein